MILTNKNFVFHPPKMMKKQAVLVCKLMRFAPGHCNHHKPFFTWPIAEEAVASLFFLKVVHSSIPTSMTSVLFILAITMDTYVALRTILNGVRRRGVLGEACGTGSKQKMSIMFENGRLSLWDVCLEFSNSRNLGEGGFKKSIFLESFVGFMIIEKVKRGLGEGLF